MSLKLILNSFGIVLNIIGVLMVYFNSPINEQTFDGGDASTDFKAIVERTEQRNKLLRLGVWIVVTGSVFQLLSNFVP